MPKVHLPDGRIVNFPYTMTPEQITAEVAKLTSADQESTAPSSGAVSRFVLNAADVLNPVAMVTGGYQILRHPAKTYEALVDASAGQFTKAGQAFKQGRYSEALGHGAAGLLPGIGPAAAEAGEQIGAGDVAGGLGRGTALVAAPQVAARTGRLVARTGGRLQRGGVSMFNRMLKPNKGTLEQMPTFGKDLPTRSRNISEALIQDPNAQISTAGANRYDAATRAIQDTVDEIVAANPEARGSTAHMVRALRGGEGTFRKQWAGGSDVSAYRNVADEALTNPRLLKSQRRVVTRPTAASEDLGPLGDVARVEVVGKTLIPRIRANTARELTQGTYRNLGDKAYGELKGAATEAHKAAARGGRAILNEALPQVEPLNTQIAKRIDLGQVLDEAVFRSGKNDPIGLGTQMVLSSGHLGWLPAALAKWPMFGSPTARGAYRLGGKLAKTRPQTFATATRAALLARLAGEQPER